jgi:benzylsuccinate CoA-transferase BbsF subunit
LQTGEGRALMKRLLSLADVMIDNYGSDPFPKWGLAPEQIRALNPDIITVRSSVMGRSGPRSEFIGIGNTIGAAAGLNAITGFPGDSPSATGTSYPDYSSNPYQTFIAVMAALRHRELTGEGQTVDLAQHESTVAFNGPGIAAYSAYGTGASQSANRHDRMAPHGVYRCRGEDRWMAIACENDEQWRRLAGLVGGDALASDPRFLTLNDRKRNEDALEALLNEWTCRQERSKLEWQLQESGVPASAAQSAGDLFRDPHLAARRKLVRIKHPEVGWTVYNAPLFRLSATPGTALRHPPLIGEDTDDVLSNLLGMTAGELEQARSNHILE